MSSKTKKTHLEKLLDLLQDTKDQETLERVARKIKDVACQHPRQLPAVLRQLHEVLYHKVWEARVAAGEALALIAAAIPHWTLPQLAHATQDEEAASLASAAPPREAQALQGFDVRTVLRHGNTLLCDDHHADSAVEVSRLDARLRVCSLKAHLGLQSSSCAEEALPSASPAEVDEGPALSPQASDACDDASQATASQGRPTRKRKAATSTAQDSGPGNAPPLTPTGSHAPPAAAAWLASTEARAQDAPEDDLNAAGRWPFQLLADRLLGDLLDPAWHVRHGAALGLRQLLSQQARCAGITVPISEPLSGWHASDGSGRMALGAADAALVRAAGKQHQSWLEDAVALLLSLLVLDRFADYMSDQVTAPVRETAAQALAIVATELHLPQRTALLELLVSLQSEELWEVRHGAMLGIKYLLVTSAADAGKLIAVAMPALMAAMHEADDDVRVAAAQACLPAVDTIAAMGPGTVHALLDCLWAMLPELSDISAATSSVLQLLGALQSRDGGGDGAAQGASSAAALQARLATLWPFFRHPSSDVQVEACACARHLCRAAFTAPTAAGAAPLSESVRSLLHQAYQTVLTSEHARVVEAAEEVVQSTLHHCPKPVLGAALDAQLIQILAGLPCLSASEPLDDGYLFAALAASSEPPAKRACGWASGAVQIAAGHADAVEGVRVRCARLFAGCLAACAAQADDPACEMAATNVQNLMGTFLQQYGVAAQTFAAHVYFFWLMSMASPPTTAPAAVHAQLYEALERAASSPIQELATPHADMITKLAALLHALSQANTPAAFPPGVALDTIDAAYATTILAAIGPSVPEDGDHFVALAFAAANAAVARLTNEAIALRCQLSAAIAAACAAWRELPLKVTVLVQALMAGVRRIADRSVQQQVLAPAMAELVVACAARTPCPNGKILRHLSALACQRQAEAQEARSQSATPAASPPPEMLSDNSGALNSGVLASAPSEAVEDTAAHDAGCAAATAVLQCLSARSGAALPELLPQLWAMLTAPAAAFAAASGEARDEDVAQLLTSAQLLRIVAGSLHAEVHERLSPLLLKLVACMERAGSIQTTGTVAHSLVALAAAAPHAHLEPLVSLASALMHTCRAAGARHAGVALLAALLDPAYALTRALLPYVLLVTTPALACMSDALRTVREPAAAAFGRLMALLPLAERGGLPPTPTLPPELRAKRESDAAFLQQLLEASSVAAFEPPVLPRGVEFRAYQRDGIAWLAFLRRFGLHGILADDMGLGKTLQTLTIIVAAMHDARSGGGGGDHSPAPSLVVCPSSLVGHWTAEVQRFFGHSGIEAVAVQGTPAQRASAQQRIAAGGAQVLVVTSYETVRSSGAWLAQQAFEYCVLDEGHIIRNPKAKVSRACKQIVARHRLLLSGTPIQNNARELWSLFDFLMPGLLGSEAAFSRRFRATAPPGVSHSRRSAARAQSALQSALDELHQQVLPFVLRRTKDQVLHDLPPKLMQDLFCDLSPLQQALYEGAMAAQQAGAGFDLTTARRSDSLEMLGFLRKLCTHPCLALDWKRPDHVAALHAALPALAGLDPEQAHTELARLEHSPKLQALKQLFTDCGVIAGPCSERDSPGSGPAAEGAGGHRVLVFAQLRGTLDLVEDSVLAPAGSSFVRLDGSVKASERQAVVQRFNGDPTIGVMLLTTAVGSLGLNLTSADTVVFLEHDWNPMKDMQAMDRAHRLGQQRVVTVYRLLMRATLEERIMSLQQFKKDVASAVVNTDNVATDTMATGDVLDVVGQGTVPAAPGSVGGSADMRAAGGEYDDAGMAAFLRRLQSTAGD